MEHTGTRALIYVRASSDPKMQFRSVGDQEADCQAWADREGWTVIETVRDANRSATKWARREREGFGRVLDMVRSDQVDVLVMWEASRGARQMEGFLDLRTALTDAGTLLAYSGRVYDLSRSDDVFTTGLDALLSEREASGIRDRIVRTVRMRAEKGTPHGVLSYGYRRIYDPATGALTGQEADPTTGPIAQEVCARILVGDSLNAIAKDLNARGVPTPQPPRNGGVSVGWLAKTIKQVVSGPSIAGLRKHQGEVVGQASWDGLISEADWRKIMAILADPARVSHRGTAPAHLLTHIARCGTCGSPMVRTRSSQTGKVSLRCSRSTCEGKASVTEEHADAYVLATVAEWLGAPENLTALHGADDADDVQVGVVLGEIETLERRLSDAVAEYSAGEISARMLAGVEKDLQPKIDALRESARPRSPDAAVDGILASADPARAWLDAPLLAQRQMLRLLFDIRIDRARARGGRFDMDRIRITRAASPVGVPAGS